uniref:C-type lectin domain family 3 member A n=1 Tax=Sinocyclocheilus grahami TaxID=75366 RepID=A0A672RTT9_SINGR
MEDLHVNVFVYVSVCLRGIKAHRKCYLVSEQTKHYHEANEDCIAQGGTLAIPRDINQNDELTDYIKRSSPTSNDFWIGITDIVKEGQYVDVNSLPVTFFHWDQRAVSLSLAAQGKWHDEVCRSQKNYICEYLIP